jgi:nickel-dependent lactate racemase
LRIRIPYGKTAKYLEIPDRNLTGIISDSVWRQRRSDEKIVIKKAMANPVGSGRITEISRGKKSACILVSDITRPCPSFKFLPYMIDELNSAGINNIKVVFSLGIHRKQTEDEKIKLVGKYAAEKAKLIDSDTSRCRLIGHTSRGTPVEIFEEVLDSELLIATGNIEYHYYAGYSGGAKALMPGVSSYKSILKNHSMMRSVDASSGRCSSNPVRMDIEEAGKLAGIDFMFNVIIDENKNIVDAVSGANNEAFFEGINRYDHLFGKKVKERSDIVLVSPGGYPKDLNLYQAHKAIENVKDIVVPGGKLVLIAECIEGFGQETFRSWSHKVKDHAYLENKIEKEFIFGLHKVLAISRILLIADVFLFSDLSREETEEIGFKKTFDLQGFINGQVKAYEDVKITAVPGGRVVRLDNEQVF